MSDELDLTLLLEELLSKSQRNDLFQTIEQTGVPVTEFDLKVSLLGSQDGSAWASLEHQPSESYFAILPSGKTFSVLGRLRDGEKVPDAQRRSRDEEAYRNFKLALWGVRAHSLRVPGMDLDWPELLSLAGIWARKAHELAEEHANMPDLWAGFHQSKIIPTHRYENTSFTDSERSEISDHIQQVKAYIDATYELTAEQIWCIEHKLDDLNEASHRVGRKDWITMLYGAAFGMIVNDSIPANLVQHILAMAVHGLGHLFGCGVAGTAIGS
jgi:hypothetical protein